MTQKENERINGKVSRQNKMKEKRTHHSNRADMFLCRVVSSLCFLYSL